jgi:hypothetical protein
MDEKEEKKIYRTVVDKNPFEVPEHYFDNITREIMGKLPEAHPMKPVAKPQPTRWMRIRPWTYAAAAFIGVVLTIRIAFVSEESLVTEESVSMERMGYADMISDEELNLVLQNAGIDDYALYEYLTEANE